MIKKISFLIVFLLVLVGVVLFFFLSFLPERNTLFVQPLNDSSAPSSTISTPHPIVYGYLPYWTRTSARFVPELTHISYFSLGIQPDGHILNIPKKNQETGYRLYQAGVLTNLRKEILPNQKLELTLTMMDQEGIPQFVSSSEARDTFLRDLKTLLSTSPITGINIDVEYNGLVDDELQQNFALLIKQSYELLHAESSEHQLSIATYSDAGSLKRLTNLSLIAPYVDHVIMMAYDYHRRVSLNAGPNSPLYGKLEGKWESDILSDLKGYTQVLPPEKILLGIPFYGYQWQIEDESNPNSFTTPKSGATVTYEHIIPLLTDPTIRQYFDPLAYSPYLRFDRGTIHYVLYYDNVISLSYKLGLVRQAGLGGIAIWALGYEGNSTELWDTIQQKL